MEALKQGRYLKQELDGKFPETQFIEIFLHMFEFYFIYIVAGHLLPLSFKSELVRQRGKVPPMYTTSPLWLASYIICTLTPNEPLI